MFEQDRLRRTGGTVLFCLGILALAIFTTIEHVNILGLDYLDKGAQVQRHRAVLEGNAGDPWQYRVLSAYLVEGTLQLCRSLGIRAYSVGFIWFRVLEDAAIFLLAFMYYRRLGLSAPQAMIGISLLAWGMSYATFDSDLQFNTYLDVVFYLLAGVFVLSGKLYAVIPLTLLAALNRETCGLIPFLFLFSFYRKGDRAVQTKVLVACGLAMALYVAVFIGVRLYFGAQTVFVPYDQHIGWELFDFNVGRPLTWYRLLATLGFLPVLTALGYRYIPPQLKLFIWVILPVWFAVHLFAAVMAETRLFLVPLALVFVPGALFFCRGKETPGHVNPG